VFLAVAILFLNEEAFLPRMLDSVERQTRPPERLLLVDDGSDDASPEIAARFAAEHPYARVLTRPRRTREKDRLATAAELQAFQWAVAQVEDPYDVIAKLDGDLELTPRFFESVVAALEADPRLGIAGAALSLPHEDGGASREYSAPWHVRGATKFYRRECWEQISPLPPILGWDTIDEARAALRGWRVSVVPVAGGDALHLRVTGTQDGALRGFRRRGVAAWAYGAHPLNVLVSSALRMRDRPRVRGGLAYMSGWAGAALRREPRAEPEVLRHVRREQLRRLRARLTAGSAGRPRGGP
jgi:biofilm PGA synthesis N-glycosyltransferase PgaC